MSNYCLCGSGNFYSACCGQFIDGVLIPDLPEQLMQSRYVAYATNNIDYIIKTMYGKPLKGFNKDEAIKQNQMIAWQKLEVLSSSINANKGFVEFRAHYLYNGVAQVLHELSLFKRRQGKWFYIDGQFI